MRLNISKIKAGLTRRCLCAVNPRNGALNAKHSEKYLMDLKNE